MAGHSARFMARPCATSVALAFGQSFDHVEADSQRLRQALAVGLVGVIEYRDGDTPVHFLLHQRLVGGEIRRERGLGAIRVVGGRSLRKDVDAVCESVFRKERLESRRGVGGRQGKAHAERHDARYFHARRQPQRDRHTDLDRARVVGEPGEPIVGDEMSLRIVLKGRLRRLRVGAELQLVRDRECQARAPVPSPFASRAVTTKKSGSRRARGGVPVMVSRFRMSGRGKAPGAGHPTGFVVRAT